MSFEGVPLFLKLGGLTRGWVMLVLTSLVLAAGLPGCGGGGGSGNDDQLPRLTMQFSPSTVEGSTYAGESATVPFTGTMNRFVSPSTKLSITSSGGVITQEVTGHLDATQTIFYATVEISPLLAPGVYTGQLDIRLCHDGQACLNPLSGEPTFLVPYRFVVHAATNLTPLRHIDSLSGWSTFQGNAAHDGHVDAAFDPSAFLRRFTGPVSRFGVVTEAGQVFIVSREGVGRSRLTALRESDGGEAWHYDFPDAGSTVNPPAVSGGRVFLTSTSGSLSSHFWTFDALTGNLVAKAEIRSQGEPYLPATVFGGAAYSESGYYGGLASFDGVSGTQRWSIGLDQVHEWTPAVDAGAAYVYIGNELRVIDRATGALQYEIPDPGAVGAGTWRAAPVLDGNGRVFAVDSASRLVAFSLSNRRVLWSEWDAGFNTHIAIANDVLYAVRGTVLEARSSATGSIQWTWPMPEDPPGDRTWIQVVVANNLAFVAGVQRIYAVDLGTRSQVWSYPVSGTMSISDNGVLYIAPRDGGRLVAVNLH
jgi:outer membrane protein assembly factor BamB